MRKMLFANIGWMNEYKGVSKDDPILNGGRWIAENGVGAEQFNFLNAPNGRFFGYMVPPGNDSRLNLGKLGGKKDDDLVEDVLVIGWRLPSGEAGVSSDGMQTPKFTARLSAEPRMMNLSVSWKRPARSAGF